VLALPDAPVGYEVRRQCSCLNVTNAFATFKFGTITFANGCLCSLDRFLPALIAGFLTEANGNIVSFIKKGGAWTRVAVPGSTTTEIFGLNDQGIAVGMYVGQHKQTYGFIFNGGGLSTISDPNGVGSTIVNGLNNAGDLVGFYTDAKGNTDGFVAAPRLVGIPFAPIRT
jgi:hypothetical protein